MKLNGAQRDTLHSLVITQNVSGAVAFVEELLGGKSDGEEVDSGSDQASGSAAQELGSIAGTEDSGKKAGSRRK